jgi:hypothetical protein
MGPKPGGSPIVLNVNKGVKFVDDMRLDWFYKELNKTAEEMERQTLENLRKK